jgi:hypothetical protein
VERSPDGVAWQELGRVAAAGSSSTARSYGYLDAAAPAGTLVYYRLHQVDLDGTAAYSPVRAVTLGAGGLALYPNPAPPRRGHAHRRAARDQQAQPGRP